MRRDSGKQIITMAKLQKEYFDRVVPKLQKELKRKSPMAVPRLKKIVVSCGMGKIREDEKKVAEVVAGLGTVTGQKPALTYARKSIAGFNVRQNDLAGAMVTLRGERMYEFFERLTVLTLPRVKDFRGLSPAGFDSGGNYNFGITEHAVFPEIDYNKVNYMFGMNITVVTSANNKDEARLLLTSLGLPLASPEAS